VLLLLLIRHWAWRRGRRLGRGRRLLLDAEQLKLLQVLHLLHHARQRHG
jgi:hypothetical protein